MPRKKKKVEDTKEKKVSQTDEELTEEVKAVVFQEEPGKPSDTVKVKVLIGTFEFEGGVFSEGDVFEVSRERAERFEKTSVEILEN